MKRERRGGGRLLHCVCPFDCLSLKCLTRVLTVLMLVPSLLHLSQFLPNDDNFAYRIRQKQVSP